MGSAILLTALVFGPIETRPPGFRLVEAVVHLVMMCALASVVMMPGLRGLLPTPQEVPPPDPRAAPSEPDIANAARLVPASEAWAVDRLASLMSREQAWRETGLAIGDLANRVGIPEYRLRRLINQQFGYRNFAAFLNEYRLAEAAKQLGDRHRARVPILTIALDLGWGSIGERIGNRGETGEGHRAILGGTNPCEHPGELNPCPSFQTSSFRAPASSAWRSTRRHPSV